MRAELQRAIEASLGDSVERVTALSGGDINDAYLVKLRGAGPVFVKSKVNAKAGMFVAEAKGLEWLRQARALRLPEVLAVTDGATAFLALEYLESSTPAKDFDEALGVGLARLHLAAPEGFGLDHDNFIGSLPQANAPRATWAEFYIEQRLGKQVRRAVDSGGAPPGWVRRFDELFARLHDWIGDFPPARLHGDLWGGNLHVGPGGEPCLIDPAAYAGHREVDLAMMQLFGGFSGRVFAAYAAVAPLDDGAAERVSLYQLYPLLVHVNLFGGSYVDSVERALARLV
jgi:fructosamine-3-kinase